VKIRRTTTLGVTVAALIWAGATGANAAVLFDNTSNATQGILAHPDSSLSTGDGGITFTVGSNGLTLTSAVFGLFGNTQGTATVGLRLYAGATASGTALQQLAAFSVALETINNGASVVTFNTSGWTLAANTQYTVAVFGNAGSVTPRIGKSGLATGSWTSSGLTFNQFTKLATASNDNYYVQLNGTIAAVPASGAAALGGLGLAGAFRRRRR